MQLLNHKFGDDGVNLCLCNSSEETKLIGLDVLDFVQRPSAEVSELRSDTTFWTRMEYHPAMDDGRSAMVS